MTHDELIKEIYKRLIDLGYYPNNLGWMTKFSAILSVRMGRKISRITLYMALSGRKERRGPHYQNILNNLYEILTDGETCPRSEILHDKTV